MDKDQKEIYRKWKSLVNMSYSELKRFYDSEEGKKAGLKPNEAKKEGIDYGRESARWILKMKKTPVKEWTPAMWKWANKQISFISRMSGNKGGLYDENGEKTRKHLSLLIWGHNPKKYKAGGEVTSDDCIEYIKKTESILRNGYYHNHGAFYLVTYNSGGQEGLDVKQTINMNLVWSLSKLMDVPEYFLMGTIWVHYQEARRFDTIDILKELEGKKIIIADRDLVVCSNVEPEMFASIKEWANGREAKKEDMKKPTCSDFIKGSESILRNGYYSDHGLFYLITYNSSGGKGINVYQTVNYALVDKLAFFLGFSDTTVGVTLLKHYEEARRFDSLKILKEIKDKPVIIVDRDTIVCSNYDRKKAKLKEGGEVSDEMENFDWDSIYDIDGSHGDSDTKKEPKYDIDKIKSLIDQKIDSEKAVIEDWSNRNYKSNKGIVYTGGDDIHGAPLQIGSINESRRRNKINSAERVISELSLAKDIVEKYRGNESDLYNIVLDDYRKNYYRGYNPKSYKRDYKIEQRYSDAYDVLINTIKESESFKSGGEVNKETKMEENKLEIIATKNTLNLSFPKGRFGTTSYPRAFEQLKDSEDTVNKQERIKVTINPLVMPFEDVMTIQNKLRKYASDYGFQIEANIVDTDSGVQDIDFGGESYIYLINSNYKSQLSKGIEVEQEHKETLEKVASGEITPEQGVKETAEVHISEDPNYYDKLEIIESGDSGNFSMSNEQKEEKETTNKRMTTDFGSDDWLKIPDSNKYATKVVSKAFSFDPYNKEFQSIMDNFTGDDFLRPVFMGVYFDENGITATNAHMLGYFNHVSDKYKGIYCVSQKCKKLISPVDDKINENYPNYIAVIPKSSAYVYDVDLLSLKTYIEIVFRSGLYNRTTKQIIATFNGLDLIGFNGEFMISCCESFLKAGHRYVKVGINEPHKAILFVADKTYQGDRSPVLKSDFFLLMPVMIRDYQGNKLEDKFDHSVMQGDIDFEYLLNIAFDFETGRVVTKGGEVYHEINTNITKEQAKNNSQLNPNYIDLASAFAKRNKSIPILDYVAIKNNKMIVSNLETFFVISDVKLSDGIYHVRGNALFLEDKKDVDDYPLVPNCDFNIGDINRQELMYHLSKAIDYIGKDELRPHFGSIHLYKKGEDLILEATDAHALYRAKIKKFSIDGDFDYMMADPELCYKILSQFDCDDIELKRDSEYKFYELTCGDGKLYNRSLDGKYPNVETAYPIQTKFDILLNKSDLKNIANDLKVEAKKANKKAKDISVMFKFHDEVCDYFIGYSDYSSGKKDKNYIVLKSGSISCIKKDVIYSVNKFEPLIMPALSGDYDSGLMLYNLERIIDLGFEDISIGYIESNKAIIIKNKPELAGTKKTTKQKNKDVESVITPSQEPVEDVSMLIGKTINIYSLGVDEPIVSKIESASVSGREFDKRSITLTTSSGNSEIIPIENYSKLISGEQIQLVDSKGESYVIEVKEYESTQKEPVGGKKIEKTKVDESMEYKQIRESIEGLEILLSISKSKKERKQIEEAIDGLKILLDMPETFEKGGEITPDSTDLIGKDVFVSFRNEKGIVESIDGDFVSVYYPALGFKEMVNYTIEDVIIIDSESKLDWSTNEYGITSAPYKMGTLYKQDDGGYGAKVGYGTNTYLFNTLEEAINWIDYRTAEMDLDRLGELIDDEEDSDRKNILRNKLKEAESIVNSYERKDDKFEQGGEVISEMDDDEATRMDDELKMSEQFGKIN